jgi:hypothetical protein
MALEDERLALGYELTLPRPPVLHRGGRASMNLYGAEIDFPLVDQTVDHTPDFPSDRPADGRPFAKFSQHPRHPNPLASGVDVYLVAFIRTSAFDGHGEGQHRGEDSDSVRSHGVGNTRRRVPGNGSSV